MGTLIVKSIQAGASIYNLLSFEDVMITESCRICGVVLNWRANEIARFHIDPVLIGAKYVVEATGHETQVIEKVVKKCMVKIATPSGQIEGERSMNADLGESAVVDNTLEIAPGLFVVGMAANAVMGSPRMGPIFGGMSCPGAKRQRRLTVCLGANRRLSV